MKILKKTIALFLVVVLAASAFCLEAFASSRHKEGSYGKYFWEADLVVTNFSVNVTIGVNFPAGTGSVRAISGARYLKDGQYETLYRTVKGTRAAKSVFNEGYRVSRGGGRCYVDSIQVVNWEPLINP